MVRKFPLTESFLAGKTVLLTGGTGFVGKSILELILRDHFPHLKHIYLLVRGKKGTTIQQRISEEVLSNKIFNITRDQLGPKAFEEHIERKLIGVEGDISLDGLGIKEKDVNMLKKDLNYVIHCAATVDFNERLDRSLKLNTLGTMALLELCDKCENMVGMVHVSTAYVNSNRKEANIYERIYPMVFGDPEDLIKRISNMELSEIEAFTKEVVQVYPNTYTFTKSLAENMLVRKAENMRKRELKEGRKAWSCAIVRPTVVTSTATEPIPGWVDGVSAANAIVMYIGLGVMDTTPGPMDSVLDLVPVDYLSIMTVRACAEFKPPGTNFVLPLADPTNTIRTLKQELGIDPQDKVYPRIYHSASSAVNPLTWLQFGNDVAEAWKKLPPLKKRVFPPTFHKYSSDIQYNAMMYLTQQYKFTAIAMLTSLKDPKQGEKLRSLKPKLDFLYHCFRHFMVNTWFFQTDQVSRLEKDQIDRLDIVSSKFKQESLKQMPWKNYLNFFVYGMYYFVLNESPSIRPNQLPQGWDCVLHNRTLVSYSPSQEEIGECLEIMPAPRPAPPQIDFIKLRTDLVHDPKILDYCKSNGVQFSSIQAHLLKDLISIEKANQIQSKDENHIEGWLKMGMESMPINRSKLIKLKDMLSSYSTPKVIYIPTHHSNLDQLILSHTLKKYNLPTPLIASQGKDQLISYQMRKDLLISKGAFSFIKDKKLRKLVINRYLYYLMQLGGSFTIFLDDSPDHSNLEYLNGDGVPNTISEMWHNDPSKLRNKIQYNSSGIYMDRLNDLINELVQPQATSIDVNQVILVPVSLTYESGLDINHVMASWSNSNKLESDKVAILKSRDRLGRMHLSFGNPLSLAHMNRQIQQLQTLDLNDMALTNPTYMMRSWQLQCTMISPISLVALILAGYRTNRGISFNHCRTLLVKMKGEVESIGYSLDWQDDEDSTAILCYSLEVIGSEHVKVEMGKDDLDENSESGDSTHQVKRVYFNNDERGGLRLLTLLKPISHVFLFDGLWMLSYHFALQQSQLEGIGLPNLNQMSQAYMFLSIILQHHYPEISILASQQEFDLITKRFKRGGMLELDGDLVFLNNHPIIQDYLHLTSSLLHPTLDTLWIITTALSLLANLKQTSVNNYVLIVQEVIQSSGYKGYIHHPESACKVTLTKAVVTLCKLGLVKVTLTELGQEMIEPNLAENPLMDSIQSFLSTLLLKPNLDPASSANVTQPYLLAVEHLGFILEQFRTATSPRHQLPTPRQPISIKLPANNPSSIEENGEESTSPLTGGAMFNQSLNNLSDQLIKNWAQLRTSLTAGLDESSGLMTPSYAKDFNCFINLLPPSKSEFPVRSRTNSISN